MRGIRRRRDRPEGGKSLPAWRAARLRAAGFGDDVAEEIARDARYDVRVLLELVERGCPAELAVRIVAPLDEEVLR
jgi:hypothetical protein